MHRRLGALAVAAVLSLTVTACGSDDDSGEADRSTESSTPSDTVTDVDSSLNNDNDNDNDSDQPEDDETEVEVETSGEMPSYDEVKALWMANTSDTDRTSCETQETEDKDVYTTNDGDYIRFVCANFERFDYVTGADNYADNFEAATRDLMGRAVFHIPGEAYVKPAGANTDLATAIQEACGCGEVVGPDND